MTGDHGGEATDRLLSIDPHRLREDIERTAEFGAIETTEGRGRTVLTGTEPNRLAREYLIDRMRDADLEVTIDAVGNIAGTWAPSTADPDAGPIAAGSHLDSVPEGGIFDGPLGVYAALESVRAAQDAGVAVERPISVVSFTEEEGQRFADGLLGSSVATGERSVANALALTDDSGVTLESALEEIGFQGEGRLGAGTWDAWYELHIEQDTRLENAGAPVGVVTTITGITHCRAVLEGEANHAGSTPMRARNDALAGAAEVILDVEDAANAVVERSSETAVGTVGSIEVTPNATNVVPGRVELGVDIRDIEYQSMETIVARLRESLERVENERALPTSLDRPFDLEPTPMSGRLRRIAHEAADRIQTTALDLHSGAAHDTMHVAGVTDAALLFAPSRDGISHNPREWTDWEDCTAATRVLAESLVSLAAP